MKLIEYIKKLFCKKAKLKETTNFIETGQTFEEWIKQSKEELKNFEFKPHASYNQYGNQIECYWKENPSYYKYINDQIGLMLDHETEEVCGVIIHDAKTLLKSKKFTIEDKHE